MNDLSSQATLIRLKKCCEGLESPAKIYLFKVRNRNARKRREICSS